MRMQLSARTWRLSGGLGCLLLVALLAVPGMLQAAPVWCSPFETEAGQPVTPGQAAGPVVNAVGEPGQATTGSATLPPMFYVSFGASPPAIPTAIDPAGQAGSFAISTPNDRGTGINTLVRSDAGGLAGNLTFEGYFFMAANDLITAPTFVGRRLVTQKRSAMDDNSRLAVGVHGHTTVLVPMVDGLMEYDGLNHAVGETPIPLAGLGGGLGWAGAWINSADNFRVASGSLTSPASPFTPVGGKIASLGGSNAIAARPLRRSVDLGGDGNTLYFSALVRKNSNGASARNLEIVLTPESTSTQTARFGMTSAGQWFITPTGVAQTNGGVVEVDTTYLMIGKIASNAASPDQLFLHAYGPDDQLPASEPETWLVTNTLSSTTVLRNIRLVAGASIIGEFDDIRVGSTWESVTDPDAPVGVPQETRTDNLLSIYWRELVPGAEPEAPPTYVDHMVGGTTALQASMWYHFALTYDGTDIRWYLNGQQEGEVLNASLDVAGPARIVVGNNRMSGTSDRGFFGVLDEVRIWDKALTPAQMLVNGGTPGEGLLWQSRFETQFGQPVTPLLTADLPGCIDNSVGASGTPAGRVASTYEPYGESDVPVIPAAIDPAGLAGSFALAQPEMAIAAIHTNLPSNVGNFANAVTAQGYFNSSHTLAIPAGNSVGQRFVSMQRSASQNSVRLGIGLSANPNPPAGGPPNVLALAWYNTSPAGVVITNGTTPIVPGTWYHFAMVWDGTDIRFYLNGQLEGEVLGPQLIGPGTGPIIVGNDNASTGTRGFFGLLDRIVISDHAIAPDRFMTAGADPCRKAFCNNPFADFNGDGQVDMLDFAELQRCVAVGGAEILAGCECADRDEDGDADIDDIEEFVKCATGPGVPWSAELTPECKP